MCGLPLGVWRLGKFEPVYEFLSIEGTIRSLGELECSPNFGVFSSRGAGNL